MWWNTSGLKSHYTIFSKGQLHEINIIFYFIHHNYVDRISRFVLLIFLYYIYADIFENLFHSLPGIQTQIRKNLLQFLIYIYFPDKPQLVYFYVLFNYNFLSFKTSHVIWINEIYHVQGSCLPPPRIQAGDDIWCLDFRCRMIRIWCHFSRRAKISPS